LILYLHGFASSAQSTKAAFFAAKLRERGIGIETPDLNQPDFSTLTITRMIEQVTGLIDAQPDRDVILIGSSLGGFVAVQVALQRPERVRRLILLAPALDFGGPSTQTGSGSVGDRSVDEWRRTNRLDVFHYGYGRVLPLHYDLYADAQKYNSIDASLKMSMPIQVFQGRLDAAVDPDLVERWAKARSNVELHLLDDDHQLTASLPYIWSRVEAGLTSKSPDSGPGSGKA
jgi:uncharacterized protein